MEYQLLPVEDGEGSCEFDPVLTGKWGVNILSKTESEKIPVNQK